MAKDKEKAKMYWSLYYEKHKEAIKEKRKQRYLSNLEVEREKSRNNSKKYSKEYWREVSRRNRESITKSFSDRVKRDPLFKIRVRLSNKLSKCLRGKYKDKTTVELLGCTLDYFKSYLESKFTSGMSWENYGKDGWHVDHIKPCCLFNFNEINDRKLCFHYTNMQPMWAIDNFKKGKKYHE